MLKSTSPQSEAREGFATAHARVGGDPDCAVVPVVTCRRQEGCGVAVRSSDTSEVLLDSGRRFGAWATVAGFRPGAGPRGTASASARRRIMSILTYCLVVEPAGAVGPPCVEQVGVEAFKVICWRRCLQWDPPELRMTE